MSINDILIDENNEREKKSAFIHAMSFLPPFTTQSGRVKSTMHALVFFIWIWRSY